MKDERWVFVAVVGVLVLALAQPVAAPPQPMNVWGLVTYNNGTVVPDGWTVSIGNLDIVGIGEPWNTTTDYATWGTTGHNYFRAAEANSGNRVQVSVYSPDMTYVGTATKTYTGASPLEVNVTVSVAGSEPIVINPSATPSTIVLNTQFTELRVDVADKDSLISNVTIDLSPIGGNALTYMYNIGNYTQDSLLWTMYNFSTNASVEGTFNLTVTASDINGNINDSVTIPLTVVSGVSLDIPIYSGWNLISLPATPGDLSFAAVIGGNAGLLDEIYEYDNTGGYSSSMYTGAAWAGTVTTFEPGKGYWYNRKGGQFTLTVAGQPFTGTISTPIYNGWNLVGYQSMQSQALGIIGGNAGVLDEIYEYDNTGGYSSSMYTGAVWAGTVTTFDPGKGYWYNRKGSQFDWVYTP
jgi:hypothetical protein